MKRSIGFMQGRLSPLVDGRIQAFPWNYWKEEFQIARDYTFNMMEWTLDQERLYENPLLTKEGQSTIQKLCRDFQITICSFYAERSGECNGLVFILLGGIYWGFALYFYAMLSGKPRQVIIR